MTPHSETGLLAFTIALVELVHGALLFVLLPTMLTVKLGWAMGTTGAAISTYFFTEVALKLVTGWLADRVGTRTMLIGGFWAYAAAFTWLVFATHTWEVFVALGLMGAGASPLWPAALSRLTRGTAPAVGGTLGRVFSTWFLGGGVGIAIATLVSRAQHPISLRLFIAPLLAAALLGMRISHEDPAVQTGPRTSARRALATMMRSLVMLAVSIVPQIMAAGILIPIVVPYFEFFRGLDERQLLLLLIIGPGIGLALMTQAGHVGDRLGWRRTYAVALGAIALLLLLIPACDTLWQLALDFAAIGAGYAFVLPAWNSILVRLLPQDVRGAGLGFAMTIEGMGGVVGPLIGGLLWQWTTPSWPFYVSGGLLLLAAGASTRWRVEGVEPQRG
ncbi:MAG TPA: MFS transporter [bacterium]|nr:MFS transporter [bacterium]